MKQKSLILTLMLALVVSLAPAAIAAETLTTGVKPGQWTQDLDAARKYAKEKDLPLMLMFTGSDWCYWCKLMDANVFSADDFYKYADDHLVLVTIDFPKDKSKVPAEYQERNQKLGKEFKIRGVPTYVILKPDGQTEIGRLSAGKEKTPESFIKEVKDVLGTN